MPKPKLAAAEPIFGPFGGPEDVSLRHRFNNLYIKYRAFNASSRALNKANRRRRAAMIALSRRMWAELQGDSYGIAMPKTWFVIGHEPPEQLMRPYIPHRPWEHKPGYYMIAEEVIGRPLTDMLGEFWPDHWNSQYCCKSAILVWMRGQ